jgi:hypothetical protein
MRNERRPPKERLWSLLGASGWSRRSSTGELRKTNKVSTIRGRALSRHIFFGLATAIASAPRQAFVSSDE